MDYIETTLVLTLAIVIFLALLPLIWVASAAVLFCFCVCYKSMMEKRDLFFENKRKTGALGALADEWPVFHNNPFLAYSMVKYKEMKPYQNAINCASNLNLSQGFSGHSAWRLPYANEMKRIVNSIDYDSKSKLGYVWLMDKSEDMPEKAVCYDCVSETVRLEEPTLENNTILIRKTMDGSIEVHNGKNLYWHRLLP
ncbi:hypothetical protein [Desulfobotulus alkaliphilus]|nr:hypothetical protein [Desulfobotulus alkaliphilus]